MRPTGSPGSAFKNTGINPDVLQRVADQIHLVQDDSEANAVIATEIEGMLPSNGPP